MKKLSMAMLGTLVVTLAGCAGAPPMPTGDSAVVRLNSLTGDQLMARTVDGVSSKTFTYFRVGEGAHTLELAISKRGPRDSYRQCYASLVFHGYQSGQAYVLNVRSLGSETLLRLSSSSGEVLAETNAVACMPM